jgi:RNA polymerase sigma-70 factor (ECF subfamily)
MGERGMLPDQYRDVFRFVRRRVGTVEEAEDVTQEVFANAAVVLAGSAQATTPSLAWLYTVARRRIVDEARRRTRSRTVPLELVDDPAMREGYGEFVGLTLDEGLASMPDGQRVVVIGRLLLGRSFGELARELSVSEAACQMRFMRGLHHLRETFEREGFKP